jgi:subtilisin family serine protease
MQPMHHTRTKVSWENIFMQISLLVFIAIFFTSCTTTPKTEPAKIKSDGPKNYVVWNKNQFLKPKGLVTMSRSTIYGLAKTFGEENMKPLDGINGFTVKNAKAPLTIESDEWVVQEEIEYHTMDVVEIKPYTCPVSTTPVCPVCPGNPGGPTDPIPVEPAKSWGITRVHAPEAMAKVDTSNVKIGVCDTGIDMNHPMNGRVYWSQDFTGKGSAQDGNGHGEHVAGTIAGKGGVGVSKAQLAIGKGLSDQGSGASSGLSQCLVAICNQGVQAVSNSWGSSQSDPLINQAVSYCTQKGIYVFFAAGNDSGPVNWPAKLAGNNPLVFAIAASTQSDQIATFSSRGPEVHFIAPGQDITSNWIGGGLNKISGTSMATPHVAGICAYGIAKGIKPCVKAGGTVGGYPMADALETVR